MSVFKILPLWEESSNDHSAAKPKKKKRPPRLFHDFSGPRKITLETVRAIRADYKAGGAGSSYYGLAQKYGISPSHVGSIVHERTWVYFR